MSSTPPLKLRVSFSQDIKIGYAPKRPREPKQKPTPNDDPAPPPRSRNDQLWAICTQGQYHIWSEDARVAALYDTDLGLRVLTKIPDDTYRKFGCNPPPQVTEYVPVFDRPDSRLLIRKKVPPMRSAVRRAWERVKKLRDVKVENPFHWPESWITYR